jgi:hypothetical protein
MLDRRAALPGFLCTGDFIDQAMLLSIKNVQRRQPRTTAKIQSPRILPASIWFAQSSVMDMSMVGSAG